MLRSVLIVCLTLTVSACQSYRAPSMSGDVTRMSSDTLCYRHASSRDTKLAEEITRRRLDCARILESDPLVNLDRRY